MSRASVLAVLVSLFSLSLLPTSFAQEYCPNDCQNGYGNAYCDCGNCGGCGTTAGTVAGIIIAVIVGIGILLCVLSLCYRRRYYNYAGRTTYGTGQTITMTSSAVPMQAVPVGGYYSPQQPMQAIPIQYAQYPAPGQPAYNPYGATYAQTPMGGGQPIGNHSPPAASQPPAYSTYPSAPSNDIEYPSKPTPYDGERAI